MATSSGNPISVESNKPFLSRKAIWNMSMGFFGVQMGFALQNANASRILQNFGADTHNISWFWIVAPLTGMIVQPIIGHMSDSTWTRLGRRRPFFLAGAILAAVGLVLLPKANIFTHLMPALVFGGLFLALMDASFNVAMEPFRALVTDKLNSKQLTKGYAVQTILIGFGAVLGSALPFLLKKYFGLGSNTPEGSVPSNVSVSFIIGAVGLVLSILWTIFTTKEYTEDELNSFGVNTGLNEDAKVSFLEALLNLPKTMAQLGWVQFFTWFGLFSMWVYSTNAIAQHIYGLPYEDTKSATFNEAGDWVGIIFGVYNGVSALYAFLIPSISKRLGNKNTHIYSLLCGAMGLFSIYFIEDYRWLIASMVGIGIAWGSILSVPYAILGDSLPPKKIGLYMGIFNMFITIPQILNAIFGGIILKNIFGNHAIYSLILAGFCFIIAAIFTKFVNTDTQD
ncbi:MAG: MFS transporter [Leadbetterella sp.]